MTLSNTWLLPDGIKELLPEQAAAAEALRRELLNSYNQWGYQLVKTPLLEFLESMRVGTGQDLALQTFTLTDQLSGRLLGLRADATPQVARMDAHSLNMEGPVRLCYCAPVLHSTSSNLSDARELEQIGIELFGSDSINADLEVIELMLHTVRQAGALQDAALAKLDLGHVTIFRSIVQYLALDLEQEASLRTIIQRKASTELDGFIEQYARNETAATLIKSLPDLCGSVEVFDRAEDLFKSIDDQQVVQQLCEALADLRSVYEHVKSTFPNIECYFDLGEVRGYDYHTGLVFSVYKEGMAKALAKGGRYDAIGKKFGRPRAASGFSADLRDLLAYTQTVDVNKAILAPMNTSSNNDQSLSHSIARLRSEGEQVVQSLGNDEQQLKQERCDRELVCVQGVWKVQAL